MRIEKNIANAAVLIDAGAYMIRDPVTQFVWEFRVCKESPPHGDKISGPGSESMLGQLVIKIADSDDGDCFFNVSSNGGRCGEKCPWLMRRMRIGYSSGD